MYVSRISKQDVREMSRRSNVDLTEVNASPVLCLFMLKRVLAAILL